MLDSYPEALPLINGGVEESNRTGSSTTERELIELFDELRIPLLRYLSSFPLAVDDSEDVIQDAFLSLFRHLRRGKSIQNLRGWIFRAVHNLALKRRMRCRMDLVRGAPLAAVENSIYDRDLNPEARLAASRTWERLNSVVSALPEQHRWCLYLRAEGLRYREIGEILNISLGAVCASLQRSLALMARAAER